VYDVSDCRRPTLKSSGTSQAEQGHAGEFTPDGRTYFGTHILVGTYPIDLTDPARPTLLKMWKPDELVGRPHDVAFSEDGTRMYIGQPGLLQNIGVGNGLVIVDVGDVQKRRPDPQFKIVSSLFWKDSAVTQDAVPVKIGGKPYLVVTDENGAGGYGTPAAACAQRLPPFGSARIIDIGDERHPRIVSKLMLEVHDPVHCDILQNDPAYNIAPSAPGYSSHYCGFDDPQDAHLAACTHFEGGLRVFDIHDPAQPREVAYYKPPAVRTAHRPGSWRGMGGADRTTDFTTSQVRFRHAGNELHLWFTSHDNGFQIVKFTNRLASVGKTPVR
jgi:hypothetical protein